MSTVISPMLVRLADERATGVLIRDHGALYLADGQVVHAEAPAAPGLDVLLMASGRLRPDRWEDAIARAGARNEVARYLVDSGQVAGGELEICHLAALYDAAYFALAPAAGPTRFRYGVHHWLGRVRPVPTRSVEREALRRGRLLHSVWPHPSVDTAPVAVRPYRAGQALSPVRRSLLALADGVRTPAAIARELGRPAFNTLIEVRRLAAEGLIGTPSAPCPQGSPRFRTAPAPLPPGGPGPAAHGNPPGTPGTPRHARPGPAAAPAPGGQRSGGRHGGTGTRATGRAPGAPATGDPGPGTGTGPVPGTSTGTAAPGSPAPTDPAANSPAPGTSASTRQGPDGPPAARRAEARPGADTVPGPGGWAADAGFPGLGPLGLGPTAAPDTALLRRIRDALEAPL
ncbi:hypothetical protein ACFYT4_03805 [Streptomyces sp. NPDC004609]|uniref:hypothetical protein n=1 Tax=Streptomyces sp. NPDC004609 TaxID=3364704 RepID=UPI0036BC3E1C